MNRSEEEILSLWKENASHLKPRPNRLNIKRMLAKAERECVEDVNKYLELEFALIDEVLNFMILLHRLSGDFLDDSPDKTQRGFVFLIARSCSLIVAIRKLVLHGLDDAAKVIARSLLETLDLAIISLRDADFADKFIESMFNDSENEFWKSNIAYGKIDNRINILLKELDYPEDARKEMQQNRKYIKGQLSSSVHSSARSAIFTGLVPPIAEDDVLYTNVVGKVSIYARNILCFVIDEVIFLGATFLNLTSSDEIPPLFENIYHSKLSNGLLASLFTISKLWSEYNDVLFPGDITTTDNDSASIYNKA